jgi:hypothetical protein
MNASETIRTFLEFFGDLGHRVIPGNSLVPPDGDQVLFTTAGMHPLTPYLEGRPHPQGRRLAGVQRCLRTTDLDEVGDDRHLTVFQMLGSWSLGDYDGPQSLRWGWELLTDRLGISRDRLHATVFGVHVRRAVGVALVPGHLCCSPLKISRKNRKTFRMSRKIDAARNGAVVTSELVRSRWKSNMVNPAKMTRPSTE